MIISLIDNLIVVTAVALFAYAVLAGLFSGNPRWNMGRVLVATGLLVGALAELAFAWFLPPAAAVGNLPATTVSTISWIASRAAFSLIGAGLLISFYIRRRIDIRESLNAHQLKVAADSVNRFQERYQALFENTKDAVYSISFREGISITDPQELQLQRSGSGVVTECNAVFARSLGHVTPETALGYKLRELDIFKAQGVYRRMALAFIRNDYRLRDYELEYESPSGRYRLLRVNLTGIIENYKLVRVLCIESNLSDLRDVQIELKKQKDFEALLVSVSSRLVVTNDLKIGAAIEECLREVCHLFGAEMAWLTWTGDSKPVARYRSDSVQLSLHKESRKSLLEFPQIAEVLLSGQPFVCNDLSQPPEKFKEDCLALWRIDVAATIALPMMVSGKVVGIATFGISSKRRTWSDQDVLNFRVFTELFANCIQRMKSRRALDAALSNLKSATEKLRAENISLREEIQNKAGVDYIVGNSNAILTCLRQVEQVADTMTTVLLLGETGTGKELMARALHESSSRSKRPLIKVNCAALPANLIESELFGFEKGAFTGANQSRRGRFELAHGSTLFLDEIGEIPIELQAKLLRVLQDGEFERLGGSETIKVDVRIIVATNCNLRAAVASKAFRADLFFRINTFPIELPPLRDRGVDVQLLAEYFVKRISHRLGKEVTAISAEMMQQLLGYSWPGNVRELEGVIERALIASDGPVLELAGPLQPVPVTDSGVVAGPRIVSSRLMPVSDLHAVERDHILSVLEETGWKISGQSGAATRLALPPSTLRSKMKKLAIERPSGS